MSELYNILTDYLKNPNTDFAFFINGEWGSGKTYFLKEKLFPEIKKIPSNNDGEKKFEPIYISLFGISDINEIDRRLVLELNPKLKTKGAYAFSFIFNKLTGLINLTGFNKSDFKDYLSIFSIPSNKVLCFDDLERIEEEYLNEVLGYINSFVEHQKLKILIIGDEKILETKVNDFKRTKEKLIRFTYTFEPVIESIFDEFINIYPKDYVFFLQTKKIFICKLYSRGEHQNLRTLHFNLDVFFKIFNSLSSFKEDQYYNEILDRFLFFTTTYSIEYKKEKDSKNLLLIKKLSNRFFLPSNVDIQKAKTLMNIIDSKKEEEKQKKTFEETFREKYLIFADHHFDYYPIIAHYVYSGFLDEQELRTQAESIKQELIRVETTKEAELIKKISNYFVIEDADFLSLKTEILNKVETGNFDLIAYPNIFSHFIQIEHFKIEDFLIDEHIYQIFENGIKISKLRSVYNDSFKFCIPIWGNSDKVAKEKYQRIANYAIEANDSLLDNKLNDYANKIVCLIESNNGQDLYDYMTNSEFLLQPIFGYIHSNLVFEKLKKSKNSTIMYFHDGILGRYSAESLSSFQNKEKPFFVGLLDDINHLLGKTGQVRVSTVSFTFLQRALNDLVTKYKE